MTDDPLDPRSWPEPRVQKIYLDGGKVALVDEIDYPHVARFTWSASNSRTKVYAFRNLWMPDRSRRCVYLHKVILYHMGLPPSDAHHIGDHLDGDSLNNTRSNLRWATFSENNKNLYGRVVKERQLPLDQERAVYGFK